MGRPAVVAALLASLALLGAACTGSSKRLIPPPPDTVARISTAPPARDYSDVALSPVQGRTITPRTDIMGGEAILSGQVVGPDGPVAGATVRVERFVGDATARLDIVTNADGSWQAPAPPAPPPVTIDPLTTTTFPGQFPTIPSTTSPPVTAVPPSVTVTTLPPGLLGGRYRIRAWRSPDLALTIPQILFVEAKQRLPVALVLSRFTGLAVTSLNAPDPPVVGGTTTLTAVVSTVSVDDEGVVRSVPVPGATASLAVGSGWQFSGGSSVTNGQGRATFSLTCQTVGASPIELTINGSLSFSLTVRACVAPPSTTTTSTLPFDPFAPTTSTVFVPGGSTVTSRRTTSTT